MPNLRHLQIKKTKITQLTTGAVTNLAHLNRLDITANTHMTEIQRGAFSGSRVITHIDRNGDGEIREITRGDPEYACFFLNDNRLLILDEGCFLDFDAFCMHLNDNQLTSIGAIFTSSFANLYWLNLAVNTH